MTLQLLQPLDDELGGSGMAEARDHRMSGVRCAPVDSCSGSQPYQVLRVVT